MSSGELKIIETLKARFPFLLIPRAENSHKGTFGSCLTVGGDAGMGGAVYLASTAALLMGVGKSYALFVDENFNLPFFPNYPEIMLRKAENFAEIEGINTIIIGCGLGLSKRAEDLLFKTLYKQNISLIIDADALNLVAKNPNFVPILQEYSGNKVLTPHPAEAARLLNKATQTILDNPLAAASDLAKKFNSWVVLKGSKTFIANPSGKFFKNDSGNASLATAGTGDVLAGMIGGLLSSGIDLQGSILSAVYLHGASAQFLSKDVPMAGFLASEIAKTARDLRHRAMLDKDNNQDKKEK